ncbi:MAG: hypothetical protein ACK552_21535, partial [Microcystis sp.]
TDSAQTYRRAVRSPFCPLSRGKNCPSPGWRLFIFLRQQKAGGELIIFTYLVAFGACVLFNLVDVTLSDVKINTIVWFLLAAIAGVSQRLNYEL